MASSSSSAAAAIGDPPSEKLTRTNYPLRRAQVLPALRGAQLIGLLEGTEPTPPKRVAVENPDEDKASGTAPNPEYTAWLVRHQQVLSYVLNSLSKEILMHVLRIEHAADVWKAGEEMFASQSRSTVTNLRIALANTKKKNMSTSAFVSKMQSLADELEAAGCPLDDEEVVSFILAGLGHDYDALVSALGVMNAH